MAAVLCVGGTESLHSRNLVLQSAGFDVTVATSEAAAIAAVSSTAQQAVILDSSSTDRPAHLATELKRLCPAVPVLLVADNAPDETIEPEYDRIVCRLDGPVVLLQTLQELISGVTEINRIRRRSARETRAQSRKMCERLREMRF